MLVHVKYLPDLLVETISSQKAGLSGTESRKRNNGHAMEKLAALLLANPWVCPYLVLFHGVCGGGGKPRLAFLHFRTFVAGAPSPVVRTRARDSRWWISQHNPTSANKLRRWLVFLLKTRAVHQHLKWCPKIGTQTSRAETGLSRMDDQSNEKKSTASQEAVTARPQRDAKE